MLLKFAYQDFLDDRRFKNTTKTNIKNYEMILAKFIDYGIENQVVNVEDLAYSHVRQYLLKCQEKGDKPSAINTKLMRIRAFLNYRLNVKSLKIIQLKKSKCRKMMLKLKSFRMNK
ncbi:MAG: site-specific integrase [Bacillota bacterium]|nr:site-specific integrase [Bacillota bacterium]